MKSVIYTYYNIMLNEINKDNNNYFFYHENNLFLFYYIENSLDTINYVYNYYKHNNIECYEIIVNKDNSLFTNLDGKNYSLLKINGILKYEVKFDDFMFYPVDRKPNNWGKLWGDRLDYYEIQLGELGFNYQTVLNSYGFFSGLAENAILYYNLTINTFKDEDALIGIVHNRLKYPCYLIDYNNPLNFLIDYSIRDISEYIKSYLMSDVYNIDNVLIMLNRLDVNKLMFNLMFSRLLYPTFYFDIFDRIILEDGLDNDVVAVLDRVDEYINLLKQIYFKFKDKYNMFNIEWLNKNVEN